MTDELVLSQPVGVAVAREIDGVEMGVLLDGRSYLTARGLARLCGVAPSAILNQGRRWLEGDREGKLAQMLLARGLERPSLYIEVERGGTTVHAYTDDICMPILEYYAFEATPSSKQAQQAFRGFAQAGLRLFVYRALGYDPAKQVPTAWRQFHDRLALHVLPFGYFSVFRELSEFVLAAIRGGLPCDEHTIPDISVGQLWSTHWQDQNMTARFGERTKADHNYPDYFPQAVSNPQPIWVYPIDALGEFRRWLMTTYIPNRFPKYLDTKVRKGVLPATTAEVLLAEVTPPPQLKG